MGDASPILLLFHPKFADYMRPLSELTVVYHAFDVYSGLPGWNRSLEVAAREVVERADLIFASSDGIGAELPGSGAARYQLLENGADFEAFSTGLQMPCPADLANIPRPRIGYVGRVTSKLDFALMAELAMEKPGWHWVFTGPIVLPRDPGIEMGALARTGIEALRGLRNVHFLGEKRPNELPAYVAHMDVNTLCYRLEGGWWVNCYPLKLHEYLASGRPVVSTPLAVVRPFRDVVALASTRSEWLAALTDALEVGGMGTAEARRDVASRNSWDQRVDVLERCLFQLD